MNGFLKNIFYFFLLGFVAITILTIGYVYYDPFKVLKPYDDYSNHYVSMNRDYISTEIFIKNKNRHNYNSFIFGSSRTLAFKPSSWSKYLDKDAKPFVFAASCESIYGIYLKLKFLDSLNVSIDNVVIILCRDYSFQENNKGHLFIKHPVTSGESNLRFQLEFYKAYLSPRFLFCFYTYMLSNQFKPYMTGYIENEKSAFDTITNELILVDREKEIAQNATQYYVNKAEIFYERIGDEKDSVKRINEHHLLILNKILFLLKKNKTNYKVVLSPLYEQIKFNTEDISQLKNIFGDRLYDFSGKNSFTDFKTNYYERSHFTPKVGDSIFAVIYK